MIVEISLKRDDGMVLLTIHADALNLVQWIVPQGQEIIENGMRLNGFVYRPHVSQEE